MPHAFMTVSIFTGANPAGYSRVDGGNDNNLMQAIEGRLR